MKTLIILALLGSFNLAAADTKADLSSKELIAVQLVKMAQCDKTLKVSHLDTFVLENGSILILVTEKSTAKLKPEGFGVEYMRSVTFSDVDSEAIVISGCQK